MRLIAIGIVALTALAGCQARMTLEEAQAQCAQKGGLLAIIYTQKITAGGIGEPIGSPGECVQATRFAPGASAPPPAKEQP